jgi:hypothetical protein
LHNQRPILPLRNSIGHCPILAWSPSEERRAAKKPFTKLSRLVKLTNGVKTNKEPLMLRDHMINFLEAAVVFLLLTNAVSILAVTRAMQLLTSFTGARRPPTVIERKLNTILGRTA